MDVPDPDVSGSDPGQPVPPVTPASQPAAADPPQPQRQFRMTRLRRIGNAAIVPLIRAGVVPDTYLLTTRGRRSGKLRTTPVTLVETDGRRWLVAPYGTVSWVHNARAAGQVSLTRRLRTQMYTVREVSAEQAGPVLKRYVEIARVTRPYFQATPDAPVEQFVAEADRHPVFELTVIPAPGGRGRA